MAVSGRAPQQGVCRALTEWSGGGPLWGRGGRRLARRPRGRRARRLQTGLGIGSVSACRRSLGNVVDAARVPRVTPRQPARGKPRPLDRTEAHEGGHGIRRARGIKPARRRQHRRHAELVDPHEHEQGHGGDLLPRPRSAQPGPEHARAHRRPRLARAHRRSRLRRVLRRHRVHRAPPAATRTDRASKRAASASSSAKFAAAAAGRARTTTSTPAGMPPSLAAVIARSRRVTRLRTTAFPTALDTTKPTRGARWRSESVIAAWITRNAPPLRAPRGPRTAARNCAASRSRCRAGSTRCSGSEFGAALAAAAGDDRAARAGAHPLAEAVRLGATTVVGLEGALAHGQSPSGWAGTLGARCGGRQVTSGSQTASAALVCRSQSEARGGR